MENLAEEPLEETVSTSTAVAKREPAQLIAHDDVMAIMPRSIEEASRYATGLCNANIVPDAFRYSEKDAQKLGNSALQGQPNHGLVLMGILKSMEVGVPPQTGLAGLLPLNGRFSVWGDLAQALVQRTGQIEKHTAVRVGPAIDPKTPLGEWPLEYGWEVRFWRRGQAEPYIGRYTVADAKRANLWMAARKQPWISNPDRMLFNRARAFALRDGFADGLHGLSIAEEVIDALPLEDKALAAPIDSLVDEETAPEPGDE